MWQSQVFLCIKKYFRPLVEQQVQAQHHSKKFTNDVEPVPAAHIDLDEVLPIAQVILDFP